VNRRLLAGLALAALAGCGTTVPLASNTNGTNDLGTTGTTTGTPAESGTTGVAGTSGDVPALSGTTTGAVEGTTGESTPAGTTGTSTSTTGGPVLTSGRGFTKDTITLGIADIDLNTYAQAAGLSGVAVGDIKAQAKVVVDDINRRGGLLGRKIKLAWYNASTAQELNDPATSHQAACASWTQDSHVFAVVGPMGLAVDDVLLGCLTQAGIPLVGSGNPWGIDTAPFFQSTYNRFPTFVNIGSMLGERWARIAVRRLVERTFFTGWNTTTGSPGPAPMKLGIVAYDSPNGKLLLANLTRNLALYGIKPADVVYLSGDNISSRSAQGQNAVLRFRQNGITHVIGPVATRTADAQRYYPRYFVPIEAQVVAANAPPATMRGAMSEAYLPDLDVLDYPGPPSAAATSCEALMKKAGQVSTGGTMRWGMHSICDGFFFLEQALKRAGVLSTAALISGFEHLGSSVPSAVTWTTALGPKQHGSVNALRDLAYYVDCSCFRYVDKRNFS
jgi:hypothetical protein